MKHIITSLLFVAALGTTQTTYAQTKYVQLPTPDKIQTNIGDLEVQPITHASIVLTWHGKTIYVDPTNAPAYKGMQSPDIVLITDIHGDHMDVATLEAINTVTAKIIAPQAVADKLPEAFKTKVEVLANGKKTTVSGIDIAAIPMYNLPEVPDAMHPKGRGNGYILQLGNKRIYISGDTEDTKEMRSLKDIDVAFICMNLPYTMTVEQAASAVLEFKPDIVYPYHYRGKKGFSSIHTFKTLVDNGKKNIDVRLKDWYME